MTAHPPNRYDGTCYRCGARVKAGEGVTTFLPLPSMVWPRAAGLRNVTLVEHSSCHQFYRGTKTHWQYQPEERE